MSKKLLILSLYIVMLLCCLGLVGLLCRFGAGKGQGAGGERVPSAPSAPETPGKLIPATESEATPATASEATPEEALKPSSPVRKKADREPEKPEPYRLPSIIIATDMHYFSPDLTDYGKAFQKELYEEDGKVLPYLPQLMDAFLDEVIKARPTALVLSGDLTLNGEKKSHEELAKKLRRVEEAGIPVLVIPGNHDINNPRAAACFGAEKEKTDTVTPDEFLDIYHEFGWDQAFSRDENSLSYMYRLDDYNWMMMLDSCQYEPYNLVGGRLSQETRVWMSQQLDGAARQDIRVIPVAHHNLLSESRLYPTDCAIEGNEQLISILENWKTPLYLSGHLHLQRIMKHKAKPDVPDDGYGIYEAVTSSLAIPPFQYGIVKWTEDRGMIYATKSVDVGGWARKNGIKDENLLSFDQYGIELMDQVIGKQIEGQIRTSLPEEQRKAMAHLYSVLNRDYCAGNKIDPEEVYGTPAYFFWQRNLSDTRQFKELTGILSDTKNGGRDCHYLEIPGTGYTLNPPKEVIHE